MKFILRKPTTTLKMFKTFRKPPATLKMFKTFLYVYCHENTVVTQHC